MPGLFGPGGGRTISAPDIPYGWIREELLPPDETIVQGMRSPVVKNIQEHLYLCGHPVAIDGTFGVVTFHAVRNFQRAAGLRQSGKVDARTFDALTAHMRAALTPIDAKGRSFAEMVVAYAERHIARGPKSVGGFNCGPWIRLYMSGKDGPDYGWSAGFVSFILRQAADSLGIESPVAGSWSCENMANSAKKRGLFVPESEIVNPEVRPELIHSGAIFLSRQGNNDWSHAGLVHRADQDFFISIEGDPEELGTTDHGTVCSQMKGYAGRDFIIFAG